MAIVPFTMKYTHPPSVTLISTTAVARFQPWDNPSNMMDQRTSHTIETVINVGILPLVVCGGITTNILNMLVFARQGLRDRINVCLFSLALADCGYLMALFIYKSFSLLSLVSTSVGDFWKVRSLNTIIGVFWGFSTTSNLLTLLVSLERCLCVVSPLRAKQLLKTKVMVIIIVIIYLVVLSSSMIFNVKFKVGTVPGPDSQASNTYVNITTNSTSPTTTRVSYIAVLSDFYLQHKLFVDIVYNYVMAIALPFASLVVVVISTATTVVCLKRALAWKQSNANVSAPDKKEAAVTKMLLIVCYVYVICVTPSVTNAFVVQFVSGWLPTGRYSNTFYVYVALMHMLTALNSSVNFFIYYYRGSRFRMTLAELCGCCFVGRRKGSRDRLAESMDSVTVCTAVNSLDTDARHKG